MNMVLHASHAQNRYQHDFLVLRHVQVPDEEDWEQPKSEVTYGCNGTVGESNADNNVDVDAGSSVMVLIPEVPNRGALQDGDEEEDESGYYGRAHDAVDDPAVMRLDSDTKEEETDGDLGAYHAHAIRWIAKIPPLMAVSHT